MKKLALIILPVLLLGACTVNEQKQPPNIIIFLADDQNPSTIGAYGNEQVKTPNIDKLAERGLMFMNNYATTSICMASRASIMTGLYEYRTGCNFKHGPLHDTIFKNSYPLILRENGYYTGFAGKFGFAVVSPNEQAEKYSTYDKLPVDEFDWWAGGPGQTFYTTSKNEYLKEYAEDYPHSTRAYGAACQDFIKEAVVQEKPFCLSMSFKAPHRPNTPDPYFDAVYADTDWIKPENYGREHAKHLPLQSKLGRQYLNLHKSFGYLNSYQESIRNYNQLIHGIDHAIGMVMEELERQGISDNTVIIYTADNGYNMGAHGLGGKVLPYEEGSKTPLIIFDPRNSAGMQGKRSSAVTANIDIAPTVLGLAGVDIPEEMDGKSLYGLLKHPDDNVREALPLIQAWGTAPSMALSIVSEEYKYLHWFYADGLEPGEELYHLKTDPLELKNLVLHESHADALSKMQEYYDEELALWKGNAVSHAGYQEFSKLFDRELPWEVKQEYLDEQFMDIYKVELQKLGYEGEIDEYEEIITFVGSK